MAKRTERNDGVVHCRLVLPLLFYRLNRIQTFTSHVEARFPTRQTRVPLILSDVTTPNSPNAVYHPRFVHTCFARMHRVHLFSTARFARLCRIHSTAASERRERERERERMYMYSGPMDIYLLIKGYPNMATRFVFIRHRSALLHFPPRSFPLFTLQIQTLSLLPLPFFF